MIDSLFVFFPLAIALLIGTYTVWMIVERPHRRASYQVDLPTGISVKDIGFIERDLENLKMVIVIADKVERPTSQLSDAVEYNFSRGVKYLFLVSADRAQKELQAYITLFEAFARLELNKRPPGASQDIKDLIEIKQLPYNWDDYPYIFYQVQLPNGKTKTLAFRSDELHEGIANHYGRVDPIYAHTIARAIKEEAPRSVALPAMEREQFDNTAPGRVL